MIGILPHKWVYTHTIQRSDMCISNFWIGKTHFYHHPSRMNSNTGLLGKRRTGALEALFAGDPSVCLCRKPEAPKSNHGCQTALKGATEETTVRTCPMLVSVTFKWPLEIPSEEVDGPMGKFMKNERREENKTNGEILIKGLLRTSWYRTQNTLKRAFAKWILLAYWVQREEKA